MTPDQAADKQPIVFSCGGKSHIAQIANDIASALQKNHFATMGCISAIDNDLSEQLIEARNSPSIIAIDACQYQCVKKSLAKKDIRIDHYFNLLQMKENQTDEKKITLVDAMRIMQAVYNKLDLKEI